MKYSEVIWDEFIYGGHWLSIGTSAIALSTMILLNLQIKWEFLLIVYLGTQCIYNYNHYKEIKTDSPKKIGRIGHLKKYRKCLLLITIVYGVGFFAFLLYFGNFESFIFGVLLLLLGLLFTIKFKKLTKKIIGFKTFYASFSFSLLIIFTALYYSYVVNLLLLELFIFFFLRFTVSSSFSDIKDSDTDKKLNLLTLPNYFGKQKFLTFLHILNFITFIPLFIIVIKINLSFSLLVVFSYIYTAYYIQKAKNQETDIQSLTNVMVDGEFIFWPFFLVIGLIFASLNLLW